MTSLSNFCNNVSQSSSVRIKKTYFRKSKLVSSSCFILYRLGFILNYRLNYKFLTVILKYFIYGSIIRGLILLSKPSLNFFLKYKNLTKYTYNNFFGLNGFTALSTNKKKIMLDIECILMKCGGTALWVVY